MIKNIKQIILISIIGCLIISNILTGYFLLYKNDRKMIESAVNKYPLIDFSRNFIEQKHYISTLQPLRNKVKEMVEEFGEESVSLYIEYLNTGANISINQDLYIWPASLTKVPLALAVMKKIEEGKWKFDNELVLMPGDADSKSGDSENPLSEYPTGTRFTIEKLLEELLINSDNTAYYILLRNMHKDELKQVMDAIGLESLFNAEGRMSAKEYARVLRSLYTASFLSRDNSQMILKWLDEAKFNDFISYDINKLVPLPHKFGQDDLLKVYSDAGIVYAPNRPYIISITVQGRKDEPHEIEKERVSVFMREISRVTYDYIVNTEK